ncbi:hypothetical protein EV560_10237 [Bosea sp. BK604]|nr:hypothetical protein EV560_10237 [Bosea sp. BK604]
MSIDYMDRRARFGNGNHTVDRAIATGMLFASAALILAVVLS